MNEVSNGPSGNMEYVEFVVIDSNVTYNCAGMANAPCIDIRGWIFDDNSGYHGGSGVAPGCIRFSNNAFWSCIPVGTMILIYNNLDPNSSLPPDDISMSDGNCRIVAPVSNTTLFESNVTTPGAVACSYPAAGWTPGGNWNNTLFANAGDCARIVNLAGCEVFSVCWGSDNLFNLIYFPGSAQDRVYSFVNTLNNNPSNNANWNNGCADIIACGSNVQTPGAPNNAANAAWISSFNNGCAPITPIAAIGSFTNGGCSPCTASASVSVSGSIPPYTYTWSPAPGSGQGMANASGLCTGTYSCFVKSAIGCMDTVVVNVSSGGVFTATVSPTPVKCNGLTNGSATVAVTGVTGPYSYTWAPAPGGGQGTATVSGLSAQVYSVTVKDAGGCSITVTTTITQPTALSASINTGTILCNGGVTTATITTLGGTGGYTYTWSPIGGNTSIANNLTVGTYTTIVKDINNCTVTAVTTITQTPVLTANINTGAILCNGGVTSATATALGGAGGYTYTWNPIGGNTSVANNLTAGNYTVLVKDANNCTVTAVTTITQSPVLTASINAGTILCNGGSANATITVAGGTPGYTYTWSPTGGNGIIASSLISGTYSVLVNDANNCLATAIVNITEPPPLTSTVSATNITCFGTANGSAIVTAGGGTPGYTYTWSPSGGNSSTANGLPPGTYTVTITDANNCTITDITSNITEPSPLTATVVTSIAGCGLTNASATVSASGGTPGYTFLWAPSASTSFITTGLASGNCSVTVTDVFNCAITITATVSQAAAFTSTMAVANITCNGLSNGTASVTINGGLAPYNYVWSPSPGLGQGTPSVSGLAAGVYTVTVLDVNSCSVAVTANINQPAVLTATAMASNVSCNGGTNGSATVTVAGGTGAYSYNWAPSGGSSSIASGIPAGSYTVSVTDINNCITSSTILITEPTTLTTTVSSTNVTCNGVANGSATLNVSGGTPMYSFTWTPVGGNVSLANGLAPNTYTVNIKDKNNCIRTETVLITEPPAITAITSQTNIACFGGSNGTASLQVNGGTAPYTYSWAPTLNSSPFVNNLISGSYTCLITDNNNCKISKTFSLTQPIALTTTVANYTICSGMSATISSTINGGTAPYNINWNGGSFTAQTFTDNPSVNTTYTLTVMDNNGCSSSPVTSSVSVITQPSVTVKSTYSVCSGNSTVLNANVVGATGNVNYLWSPGSFTTSAITVSPATNVIYTVNVNTSGLCPLNAQKQITVVVNPNPLISTSNSGVIGCAPLCVKFTDNSSTTTGSITSWGWDFSDGSSYGSANPTVCFSKPGTYKGNHTVVNSFGCMSTVTDFATITVYPKPTADFNHSPIKPIVNVDQEVVFTDASWGAPIISWNWYFMNTVQHTSIVQNPTFSYTEAGNYVVALVVKSDKGCLDTLLRPLVVGEDYGLYVPNAFTPNSDGLNDGFQPKGFGIVKYELYIFDRWGEKLFHTTNFTEPWDGRKQTKRDVNYEICEQGVYTWLIKATDVYGKAHELKGHVTLLK